MMRLKTPFKTLVALLGLQAVLSAAHAQPQVDVALVLAVDVSRSMSRDELDLQRDGYAAAIASSAVIQAIELGVHGRIALTMFEWASDVHVREIVPWTLIETREDAEIFAQRVLEDRTFGRRRTSISGAINHGARLLDDLPFEADRRVIDISGDGPNNQGFPVTEARDAALEAGITISGLPLMTSSGTGSDFHISDLDVYYRRCVIGGPGSFVLPVTEWAQFPEAVRRKLILEIAGLTPPGAPRIQRTQFSFEEPYDCLVGEKIWRLRRERFFLDP